MIVLHLDTQIRKMDIGTPKPSDLADYLGNNLAENQCLFDIGILRGNMIVLHLDTQIRKMDIGTPKPFDPDDHLGNNQDLSDIGILGGSMIVEVDNNWSGNYKDELDS